MGYKLLNPPTPWGDPRGAVRALALLRGWWKTLLELQGPTTSFGPSFLLPWSLTGVDHKGLSSCPSYILTSTFHTNLLLRNVDHDCDHPDVCLKLKNLTKKQEAHWLLDVLNKNCLVFKDYIYFPKCFLQVHGRRTYYDIVINYFMRKYFRGKLIPMLYEVKTFLLLLP